MNRIFIAYAREYQIFATSLARSLSKIGAEIWIDVESIPAGMPWHNAIHQGLETCDVMLLIITPESMQSRNVEAEWFYFLNENKPIIPILYRTTPVNYQLRSLEFIDFENTDYKTAFRRLHKALNTRGFKLGELNEAADENTEDIVPPKRKPPLREQDRHPVRNLLQANLRDILIGLFVTVIGGLILAFIIQADRFSPQANEADDQSRQTQTAVFALTESAAAQAILDRTATATAVISANETGTAVRIAESETAAYETMIALSATATPSLTNSPRPPTATPTVRPSRTPLPPSATPKERSTNTPLAPSTTPTSSPTDTPMLPTASPTPVRPTNTASPTMPPVDPCIGRVRTTTGRDAPYYPQPPPSGLASIPNNTEVRVIGNDIYSQTERRFYYTIQFNNQTGYITTDRVNLSSACQYFRQS